jgi:hemerythrin-like metal-binding protein
VYRAVRRSKGDEIVVKVAQRDLPDDPIEELRFLRSAALAADLKGTHFVEVLGHGRAPDGTLFLAMERLRGRTLYETMQEDGIPMSPARTASITVQVLEALDLIHDAGLIHRDLKPENIFMLDGPDDRLKILDFGLARSTRFADPALTGEGLVIGTPTYMSPEQGYGRTLDTRSDLYSVGVLLFELLSGQVPHNDASSLRVLIKKVSDRAPRISDLAPQAEVPLPLENLVADLLEVEPARRPASARLAIQRLREAIDLAHQGTSDQEQDATIPGTEAVSKVRRTTRPTRVHANSNASTPKLDRARPPNLRLVRFSPSLETGIPAVDDQHRALFDLADQILGGPEKGSTPEDVRQTITRLIEYARHHFEEEETAMEAAGYKCPEAHTQDHQRFTNTMLLVCQQSGTTGAVPACRDEVRRQMTLLVRHIRTLDRAFADFLKARDTIGASIPVRSQG